jgi:hypothetical protein
MNRLFEHAGITLDVKKILERMTMPIANFGLEIPLNGERETVKTGDKQTVVDNRYFYLDNGSNVLAVAHLDTALWLNEAVAIKYNGLPMVISPQLDDRMGAFILLDALPDLGIRPDILLTVGEERCASTAANFTTKKKYNWGFSFDRRGDDVVYYQYYGESWRSALVAADFKTSTGSYSDIAELDALGCKFVNIGCGYYNEHTQFCYADLNKTCEQIAKFKQFYETFKDMRFPHTRSVTNYKGYYNGGWGNDYYSKNNSWYRNSDSFKPQGKITRVEQRCSNCKRLLFESEEADGICGICLNAEGNIRDAEEGGDGTIVFEDSGETFTRLVDGYTFDANGVRVCMNCLCPLNEMEEKMCDDCFEYETKFGHSRRLLSTDNDKVVGGREGD